MLRYASFVLFLYSILKLMTYHTHFYHWPFAKLPKFKQVWFLWPTL